MDILATNETFSAPMDATYALLGLSPGDVTTLEQYLQARAAHPQQMKQHVADASNDSSPSSGACYIHAMLGALCSA